MGAELVGSLVLWIGFEGRTGIDGINGIEDSARKREGCGARGAVDSVKRI